jgi:hypothetical protein
VLEHAPPNGGTDGNQHHVPERTVGATPPVVSKASGLVFALSLIFMVGSIRVLTFEIPSKACVDYNCVTGFGETVTIERAMPLFGKANYPLISETQKNGRSSRAGIVVISKSSTEHTKTNPPH